MRGFRGHAINSGRITCLTAEVPKEWSWLSAATFAGRVPASVTRSVTRTSSRNGAGFRTWSRCEPWCPDGLSVFACAPAASRAGSSSRSSEKHREGVPPSRVVTRWEAATPHRGLQVVTSSSSSRPFSSPWRSHLLPSRGSITAPLGAVVTSSSSSPPSSSPWSLTSLPVA